jgi:hypothetical protein
LNLPFGRVAEAKHRVVYHLPGPRKTALDRAGFRVSGLAGGQPESGPPDFLSSQIEEAYNTAELTAGPRHQPEVGSPSEGSKI